MITNLKNSSDEYIREIQEEQGGQDAAGGR